MTTIRTFDAIHDDIMATHNHLRALRDTISLDPCPEHRRDYDALETALDDLWSELAAWEAHHPNPGTGHVH